MFYCNDCKSEFKETKVITERHNLPTSPYEKYAVCPFCSSTSIKTIHYSHCRMCGARLIGDTKGYCSEDCRTKGELLRKKELKRRLERYNSPLNQIIRKKDEYNKENGTNYSYGQFVAIIMPNKEKKKCKRKKDI